MITVSFHEHIIFVQFLNIRFDLSQLLLIAFLPVLQSDRIDNAHVSQFLILFVHIAPFLLQSFPQGVDLFLG